MMYERVYVQGEGTKLKHRHVMEQLLGRKLEPEEEVHHKDKNKGNNSPQNLELMPSRKDHAREHAYTEEDLIEFLIGYNHEYGTWPTYKECREHSAMPHPNTFARVFGSWKAAKKRAQHELDLINEEW